MATSRRRKQSAGRSSPWRSDALVGLLVVLAAFAAHLSSDRFRDLESRFCDFAGTRSSRVPSERIAVIAIDDQSTANIGRWPWPREVHAGLIDQLDLALDRFRRVPRSRPLMDNLEQLARDFGRKRQFHKVPSVHEHMTDLNRSKAEVRSRLRRARTLSKTVELAGAAGVEPPMLGHYQIEKVLDKGAMSVVYRGRDPKIGRTVAIKTLAPGAEFESPERVEQIRVDRLLPLATAPDIGERVPMALDDVRRQNVAHRDIKPANIMFDPTSDSPNDVRSLRPDLPGALTDILGKALSKTPQDRYQSGRGVAQDLRRVARSAAADRVVPGGALPMASGGAQIPGVSGFEKTRLQTVRAIENGFATTVVTQLAIQGGGSAEGGPDIRL